MDRKLQKSLRKISKINFYNHNEQNLNNIQSKRSDTLSQLFKDGNYIMFRPDDMDIERPVRESNTNFKEIFYQSPIGILLYDKMGRLTNANDSALEIARIPKLDDVLGTNLFENPIIASKKQELHEKGLIKFQDSLNLIKIKEQNIYNPLEPEIIEIDWTVSVTDSGYIIQIQDITESKKAENKTRKILENIGENYSEFDNEWHFVDINSKMEEEFGLNREDIIDKVVWELFPQTVGNKQYKEFHRAKKENIPVRFESKSLLIINGTK
jgi:PAS domain S-box-containing protein